MCSTMSIKTPLVFVLFIIVKVVNGEGCLFNYTNIPGETTLPVPLYNFTSRYELVVPDHGILKLRTNEEITLICPGVKNYFTNFYSRNSNITSVTCVNGNTVKIRGNEEHFQDIRCKKTVKGDVLKTSHKCGNGYGNIYKIGYQIKRTNFISLITLCHVSPIGITLYTEHVVDGKNLKYSSFSLRPEFSTDGLNVSIPASLSYKKVAQKSMFSKLLDSSILAGHYINENSFLARGHLTPQADFLLASSQYSTYFYINVAPQWQSINNGNWKSVESVVRKLSRTYGDLTVYTGIHDILTYENNHKIETRIYLALNEILPVPKYFWKVAYDPKSRKGIAFVIKNDPFTEISYNFCTDICTTAGYRNSAWKSRSGGYVWCCDVKDFRNIVHIPPLLLSGNGILTNN